MSELKELKARIEEIENALAESEFVVVTEFETERRTLRVALTERLRKRAKKAGVWKGNAFLTALKNARYGFDPQRTRSRGGTDGIFLLDRTWKPANEMTKKVFDRYLDKSGSGAAEIAAALGTSVDQLFAVRLVSHHMRILGVLCCIGTEDTLVLVDVDRTKG